MLRPTPRVSSNLPNGFRRHSSTCTSSEFISQEFSGPDCIGLAHPCNYHFGTRKSMGDCTSEVFCNDGNRQAIVNITRVLDYPACEDQVDGPMDHGPKVKIIDDTGGQSWTVESVLEYHAVKAINGSSRKKVTVWTVGGTNDLIVVGFSDDVGNTLYPTVAGEQPLFLVKGDDPTRLSKADAERDPRVMKIFEISHSKKKILRSVVHQLFIIKQGGYIFAKKIDQSRATGWKIEENR